ncbi:hypothetical protein [Bacillus sp. Hm123]|uniref:hypothetical protein n=1 Tax=Bacillus sp. Hm123 TaxID=3450745 RepID=UPI003F434968
MESRRSAAQGRRKAWKVEEVWRKVEEKRGKSKKCGARSKKSVESRRSAAQGRRKVWKVEEMSRKIEEKP